MIINHIFQGTEQLQTCIAIRCAYHKLSISITYVYCADISNEGFERNISKKLAVP